MLSGNGLDLSNHFESTIPIIAAKKHCTPLIGNKTPSETESNVCYIIGLLNFVISGMGICSSPITRSLMLFTKVTPIECTPSNF